MKLEDLELDILEVDLLYKKAHLLNILSTGNTLERHDTKKAIGKINDILLNLGVIKSTPKFVPKPPNEIFKTYED